MASRLNQRRDARPPVFCPLYYSDGEFHASGTTENLTRRGGCLRGTHPVTVGMELVLLLIPMEQHALLIKKATVRWVGAAHFGVEVDEADCGAINEFNDAHVTSAQGPNSIMTQ